MAPDISIVVPSHGRRLRLWWLLNSLDEQDLERDRFEVIVVHDYAEPETCTLLASHPLAQAGVMRTIAIEPGTGNPSRQRNLGWQAARAALIAFTDDDCRVHTGWLRALVAGRNENSDAILQGTTRPDPFETNLLSAPHRRSLHVDPPNLYAQTCNIAYPRSLLERLGGFDETMPAPAGEDTDLAIRATALGAEQVGVPEAIVYHSVEAFHLFEIIRLNAKWQHLAYVIRKHPTLRQQLILGVFWRKTHAELAQALVGAWLARRWPLALLLAVPYLRRRLGRRGRQPAALAVSAVEFPGQLAVDLAEMLTMARGAVRYRTPIL